MTELGTLPEQKTKEILDELDPDNSTTLDLLSVIRHSKYFHDKMASELQSILGKN